MHTNIFTKHHILYLIEDRTSDYDFFKHIIMTLFPNTTSKFICCGNCTNLFEFLKCFVATDTYSAGHYILNLSDLDAHLADLDTIVLIRDVCTASNSLSQTIQLAVRHNINIYTTTYYCFDQCFCQYGRVDRHILKNPVYAADYIWLQQCLLLHSYPNTNVNFIAAVNHFMSSPHSCVISSTFEQCVNMLYSCVYLNQPCVKVSKRRYICLDKAYGGVYKFFLDRCDFTNTDNVCYRLRHKQTPSCSMSYQPNFVALVDLYWNTPLSAKLLNLTNNNLVMAIHDLEA